MAKYIKSHSNYIEKSKHQTINGGYISERDAVTIGGVDKFAKGQRPIYKSSNFIITVNKENNTSRDLPLTKWEKNDFGEFWTFQNVSSATLNNTDVNGVELNENVYDLKNFAYYGSCSELIRTSITNIIKKFPGELHAPIIDYDESNEPIGITVFYEDTSESTKTPTSVQLKDEYCEYLLDNPFDIVIHEPSKNESEITNKLKTFANEGWSNYEIFWGNESKGQSIKSVNIKFNDDKICKGDVLASIEIETEKNNTLNIKALVGDEQNVVYLVEREKLGVSIRPKKEFLDEFYNSLDFFEKILMNKNSKTKYTAKFIVTKENEHGYENEEQTFTFPTTYGGYNLAVNDIGFKSYVDELSKIGAYYDDMFSDNLYRSMTHESIKNFDWTQIKTDLDGDETEYVLGNSKVEKLIRLFGREFDEIKRHIDGIKHYNVLTYQKEDNMPNYFLTDALEIEGWDVKNIYPLTMKETINSSSTNIAQSIDGNVGMELISSSEAIRSIYKIRLYNDLEGKPISRYFSEDLNTTIKPYSNKLKYHYPTIDNENYDYKSSNGQGIYGNVDGIYNGYYLSYNGYEEIDGIKKDIMSVVPLDETNGDRYFLDEGCDGDLRPKIKEYTNEKEYTQNEVNNHFMKMLKLNSRSIISRKGTIEGIESMLSLFGYKSKNWYESLPKSKQLMYDGYDYSISEKTMFTNGIVDKFNDTLDMHTIDWFNYTKNYSYSNQLSLNGGYISYQGLPVKWYNAKKEDSSYVGGDMDRLLYPYFDKNAELDGDMYYQMNGGWMNKCTLSFSNDNEIILGGNSYNSLLCTETLKNVKVVGTLEDLVNLPQNILDNNSIVRVQDLSTEYGILNGMLFKIHTENYFDKSFKYVEVEVKNHTIQIGDTVFNGNVNVSYPYNESSVDYLDNDEEFTYEKTYNLDYVYEGTLLKVYILPYDRVNGLCKVDKDTNIDYNSTVDDINIRIYDEFTTISNFTLFINGKQNQVIPNEDVTNYFKLMDVDNYNEISQNGWYQISRNDVIYRKIKSAINYFNGNNPHYARKSYDLGQEYINRFAFLFKQAYEENEFNQRCYTHLDYEKSLEEIYFIGFHTLMDEWDEDCKESYIKNSLSDNKVHYFGNLYRPKEKPLESEKPLISEMHPYNDFIEGKNILKYSGVNANGWALYDNITNNENQIINTKVIEITFKLKGKDIYHSKTLEEIKYLDTIVTNYMSQVIPSNAIVMVKYESTAVDVVTIHDDDEIEYYLNIETLSSGSLYLDSEKWLIDEAYKNKISDKFVNWYVFINDELIGTITNGNYYGYYDSDYGED